MSRSRFLSSFFVLGFVILGITNFQNCTDVSLERMDLPTLLSKDDSGALYSICPYTELKPPKNTKFIFSIDMSVSNIGGWRHETVGGLRYSYWDRQQNTDINGDRFNAVDSFLSGCGNQQGNEFSIIGFSHTAGSIVQDQLKSTLSCEAGFSDAKAASVNISKLAQAQERERSWYEQWENTHLTSNSWPGVLGATSYQSALNCVETILTHDLSTSDHLGTDNYHIFMISDGVPNDGYEKGCNLLPATQKESCYLEGVSNKSTYIMQMGLAGQKNVKIQGISYDNQGKGAKDFLDLISKIGDREKAVELNGFENLSKILCDAVVSQAAIDFQPDFASAINLTATRRNGVLMGDSDIDGLPDEIESELGYDPSNPRSSQAKGILDGICERLGGKTQCQKLRKALTCDAKSFNSLGLSDCDIQILKLSSFGNMNERALDSDDDGMPDFVEIIKGTNPLNKDMSQDPDSDGLSTRSELVLGRDPFFPDEDVPAEELAEYSLSYTKKVDDEPACQFGAWKLFQKNVPTAQLAKVTNTTNPNLSHDENVQVLLVYYRLDAQNTVSEKSEFFATYQKAKRTVREGQKILANGEVQQTQHTQIEYLNGERILSKDFVSLGKVKNE